MTWTGRLKPKRLEGSESFRTGDRSLELPILEFWRWSASDLVSNATRGRLAEFIVAHALSVPIDCVRDEWAAFDLETPDGVRVEVKSAAFVQAWAQRKPSSPTFVIRRTRAWDADAGAFAKEPSWQAHVFVFALLAHREREGLDPFNLDQWEFYVLPTRVLVERKRSQHSITLASLKKLSAPVSFEGLRRAVLAVVRERTGS